MNSHHCCPAPKAHDSQRPSSLQRFRRVVEWLVPGAILLAMPKCPACIAAYIALATGLGISFSAATHLRLLVLTLCITALAILTARHATAILSKLRVRGH